MVSAVSNMAALACLLDLDLRHFDVKHALVQSDLDTENDLRRPSGWVRWFGSTSQCTGLNKL